MSKPTLPPGTTSEYYQLDLVSDDANPPPREVQSHLRNLLVACELGDLVLLHCIRRIDNKPAYLICASVVSADNKRRLLPICELENTHDILSRFRPPVAAEDGFVKPTHSGKYEVCLINNPDEVALAEIGDDDGSVH